MVIIRHSYYSHAAGRVLEFLELIQEPQPNGVKVGLMFYASQQVLSWQRLFLLLCCVIHSACLNTPQGEALESSAAKPTRKTQEVQAKSTSKVLLIAWDGASPVVINELLAKGELPNLQQLISKGVYSPLDTLQPAYSPVIWTSMATGKSRKKHGIQGFSYRLSNTVGFQLFNATFRNAAALWDILSGAGLAVDVVGWWMTWPASPINGTMITDRYVLNRARIAQQAFNVELVPKKLPASFQPLQLAFPAEVGEQFESCFSAAKSATATYMRRYSEQMMQNEKAKALYSQAYDVLQQFYEQDSIYHCISLKILEKRRPHLLMYYNEGIDIISHLAWAYRFPQENNVKRAGLNEFWHKALDDYYRLEDKRLGDVLKYADASTTIMLVSDHGFEHLHNESLPLITGYHDQGPPGIFVLSGYGVKHQKDVKRRPHIYDIAPTLLRLFNLPSSKDMDGRILSEFFRDDVIKKRQPAVADYAYTRPTLIDETGLALEDTIIQRLKSLGYLE
jgi:hypothetical protein